jgi:hypothetical protein
MESLKDEEDMLLDRELHFELCWKNETESCSCWQDVEIISGSTYSTDYISHISSGRLGGALARVRVTMMNQVRVQLQCDFVYIVFTRIVEL